MRYQLQSSFYLNYNIFQLKVKKIRIANWMNALRGRNPVLIIL
nr:MAG TPA: hypothetical protein [Caudoviricetes sp.]